MRRFLLTFVFAFLIMCMPVFASTNDVGFTNEFSGGYISHTLSDIQVDCDGEYKMYSYSNFTLDDNMYAKTPCIFLLSDHPFTCTYTYSRNSEAETRKVVVNDSSGYFRCGSNTANFSEPVFCSYSNIDYFRGCYCVELAQTKSYCSGVTQLSSDFSFDNSDNNVTSTFSNLLSNFAKNCFDDFFQLPSLSKVQEMTVGEVIQSFLVLGLLLAILLIALLILVTLLVRYLRRCLNL